MPANAILSFWHWDCTTGFSTEFDWQDAYITDTSGNILQTIYHQLSDNPCWVNQTVDLTPWVDQTIRIKFLVHQDGAGDITTMFVDDVAVTVPGPCARRLRQRLELHPYRGRARRRSRDPSQLENVKAGARERLRGLLVCDGLPIRKALCFAYEVSALQKDLANTGCLYSKSPDRRTSSAFEVSAAASEPFL